MRIETKSLYETDVHEWALHDAELLRSGRIAEADAEHIAEELEGLSSSQRRELSTRLRVLLEYLRASARGPVAELVYHIQRSPKRARSASSGFAKSPPPPSEGIAQAYPDAAEQAADEMLLVKNPFPAECPFTPEQILERGFFPQK